MRLHVNLRKPGARLGRWDRVLLTLYAIAIGAALAGAIWRHL